MWVYERFGGENQKVFEFRPSVIYALAAPSTPDSVVDKAIEKAEADGVRITAPPVDFKSPHQKQETPTGEWLIGVFICRVQHKNIVRSCGVASTACNKLVVAS